MIINNRLTRYVARRLRSLITIERPPDFLIGPPGDPYLCRWWLIPRNRVFNVYLHEFRHDDDDRALHDHPWWSASLSIGGHIREVVDPEGRMSRDIRAGSLVIRSAMFAHRLCLQKYRDIDGEIVRRPAWTIFITGPRLRQWGFICPQGWRHWREFTEPDAKGQVGRGCE